MPRWQHGGLLISYILPFYVQLFLLLCYQVHFPLNPESMAMIYKKQFHIMCCLFYSSQEKIKSTVMFSFPPPLNQLGWCGAPLDRQSKLDVHVERLARKGTILQDLCSVENLSQFIIVFPMQRLVLYGDTHNRYKSRSRMKEESGRKQRRHVVTA